MRYIFAIYWYYIALIVMEALMVDRDNRHHCNDRYCASRGHI